MAKGKEPRHGTDASVRYYFNTDVHAQPTLKDDGTVDYFHLNMINPCRKGQLLAEIIPEDEGEYGITVQGAKIRPRQVKKAHLEDLLSLQLPAVDGISVVHRAFGSGTVSSCVNGRMTVRFSDTEKAFLYPKAFLSGFLKPDDDSILEQLRRITQAEEARPMLELEISDLEEQLADAQKALEE